MFPFAPKGEIEWPVDLPRSDARVLIRFRRLTKTELRERNAQAAVLLADRLTPDTTAEQIAALVAQANARAVATDAELRERVLGWRDPATGAAADFTPAELDALIEDRPTFEALLAALIECSEQGKAKNSSPGPASPPVEAQTNANADGAAA